ncbi:MAG: L,D-transpeptidase family protein [Proteobacteria bacterium]|nr:L,D-transpeptidase family protein [Pseudomonadota bacterium]
MKKINTFIKLFSLKILTITTIILFFTSITFLILFVREQQETKKLLALVLEKQDRIYAPTPQLPEKPKQEEVAPKPEPKTEPKLEPKPEPKPTEIPSKPQTQVEAKAKTPAPPVVTPVQFDSNTIPSSLIFAATNEYVLLCEKDTKMLYLFRFVNNAFTLVKSYSCLTGANHRDKQKPGDGATPEGVFFFLRFIPGKNLPKQYGFGAFVMNYPNFLARKEGRQGNGIWLHGHDSEKNIGKDIVNTKGCIVVDNKALEEISKLIKPRGTPIIVVSRIQTSDKTNQDIFSKEITTFLNSWKQSWESLNTKKFLSLYSHDFISGEGMSFAAFKQQKERVNKYKKFIKVSIEEPAVFMPPEYGGKVAVVRFHQKYNSDNFKTESSKIFYLKKEQQKWQIIGESMF